MGLEGLQSMLRLQRRRPAPRARMTRAGERRRSKQDIQIRLAQSSEELEAAYRLVQSRYLPFGYARRGASVRFVTHCCTPASHTLIATVGDTIIGTASLIVDGALGLPLEAAYPDEVAGLRQAGERLAEISCLATRRRGDSRVLLSLYRGVYALARYGCQVDRLCITVHPRQGRFYQRALLFQPIGPQRDYAACNQAPAVALGLDLRAAETRFRRMHGWGWLARFFLGRESFPAMARRLEPGAGQRERLVFAQRQADWHQLEETVRNRIVSSYGEV